MFPVFASLSAELDARREKLSYTQYLFEYLYESRINCSFTIMIVLGGKSNKEQENYK